MVWLLILFPIIIIRKNIPKRKWLVTCCSSKCQAWCASGGGPAVGSGAPHILLMADRACSTSSASLCAVGRTSVWCSAMRYWTNFWSCCLSIWRRVSVKKILSVKSTHEWNVFAVSGQTLYRKASFKVKMVKLINDDDCTKRGCLDYIFPNCLERFF